MTGLTESKKRDFISQLIVIMEQNVETLAVSGFDPAAKIDELKAQLTAADEAEAKQTEAMAAAKDATALANETLDDAYTASSATVDLLAGLLGKKDNLVLEIKKIRKGGRAKPKPGPAQPV